MNDHENAAAGFAISKNTSGPRKGGPRRIALWLLAALLLIYLASPYISFWRFTKVLRAKDRSAMQSYVDFPAVRESLKEQLRAKIPKSDAPAATPDRFAGLLERLAPALIDQLVDAFITPDGLAALIADPAVAKQAKAKDSSVVARLGDTTARELGWTDVRYAFFTRPTECLVDVNGTKLRYRFIGFRWVLKTLELPLDDLKI